MVPGRTYNFKAVIMIVAGINISGYSEDGGVEVEYSTEATRVKAGIDGEVVGSVTNNDIAIIRLRLMQTSRANRLLTAVYRTHRAALALGASIPRQPISLFDPVNGDGISDAMFYIQQVPTPSMGAEAGERVWEFVLPNGRANLLLASRLA